jgi:hypothetical protein
MAKLLRGIAAYFKSLASAISPDRRLRSREFKRFVHRAKMNFAIANAHCGKQYLFVVRPVRCTRDFGLPLLWAQDILARFLCRLGKP